MEENLRLQVELKAAEVRRVLAENLPRLAFGAHRRQEDCLEAEGPSSKDE